MTKSVINDVYTGLRAELTLASHNPPKMSSAEVNASMSIFLIQTFKCPITLNEIMNIAL